MDFEKVINHEVVGKIGLEGASWISLRTMRFLDRDEDVLIYFKEVENGNISEKQIRTFKWLIQNNERICETIEKEIFKYYKDIYEDLVEEQGEYEDFPDINDSKQLSLLLKGPYCFFIKPDWCDYTGFGCECIWEEEHGLGVKIINSEIIEIGFQDIVLQQITL